ncbi:efflux RND transporter periplasmic adaptor subunit [Pseudomonas cichorii]|uniref:efflux RND transporter periplasmic adaptor subunit n=1 Tax=Pseudomonas cichorii TaxID=36746 RepID=UPI00190FF6FF|nr:efflux RND transporter periplasmic adaptor subunit [Pseudomonas cichorii]
MTVRNCAPNTGKSIDERQRNWAIAALSLFALLVVGAISWQVLYLREPPPSEPTTDALVAMTVTDASVRLVEWPVHLNASGAIEPWQEAVIGGQVSGVRLTELLVGPGDVVRRGQVLARFETEALRADVAQLHAALRQSKALAVQAVANRERALKLKEVGAMSEQDISNSVTEAETALAQVESSQAQLTSRELQLRYATVVSPDDGVISTRTATIGTVGAVGDELFRLIRQSRLEWRGELTAAQAGQVAAGQIVTLALPDGQVAQATVRQMAPALNAQTRLAMVYADIISGSTARAGMYVQGRISVTQQSALVVPAGSVFIRDGHSHVFKLDTQQGAAKVSLQVVKTGRRQAQDVEIVQGLSEGDRVVVQGAGFVNDGDSVRIVQAPAVAISATTVANGAEK